MQESVFKIESSLDYYRITEALRELAIPFAERKFTDSAFPSFGQGKAFAELIVDPQHAELVAKIVAGEPYEAPAAEINAPEPAQQHTPSKKKRRTAVILLTLYAVVATVFAVKYWHQSTLIGESLHTKGEWSFDNSMYIERYKATGEAVATYIDANYNRNNEIVHQYDKNGVHTNAYLDENEDGFFDKATAFDFDGKMSGLSHDTDLDGYFDLILNVLENNDTIYFFDADHDSRYDSVAFARYRDTATRTTNN